MIYEQAFPYIVVPARACTGLINEPLPLRRGRSVICDVVLNRGYGLGTGSLPFHRAVRPSEDIPLHDIEVRRGTAAVVVVAAAHERV